MNRTIAQKFINYIQAFADGKTIQAKPARCNESRWEDCDNPSWSLDYEYRIKPETVYRSFKDCDELIKTYDKLYREKTGLERLEKNLDLPLIWVKSKECGTRHLIISLGKIQELDMEVVEISHMNYSMIELFDYFTFLDGSPCGVAVDEENNNVR